MIRFIWNKKILKIAGPAILMVLLSLPLLAQSGGEYEITYGEVGISGESSGGEYSQAGSVLVTDGNEISGGDFIVIEETTILSDDYIIGFKDFSRFALYWMQSGSDLPADLYEDGTVNTDDLLEFVNWWLYSCPPDWPLK